MIEPTETEPKERLDAFVEAMKTIAREAAEKPELLKEAPHTRPVRRLDEVKAAKEPIVRHAFGERRACGGGGVGLPIFRELIALSNELIAAVHEHDRDPAREAARGRVHAQRRRRRARPRGVPRGGVGARTRSTSGPTRRSTRRSTATLPCSSPATGRRRGSRARSLASHARDGHLGAPRRPLADRPPARHDRGLARSEPPSAALGSPTPRKLWHAQRSRPLARATVLAGGCSSSLAAADRAAGGKLADRWFEQFSIPGYSAYEANQRTLADVRHRPAVPARRRVQRRERGHPGADRHRGGDRGRRGREQGVARRARGSRPRDDTFVSADQHDDVRADLSGRRGDLHDRSSRSRRRARRSPPNAPDGSDRRTSPGSMPIFQSQGGAERAERARRDAARWHRALCSILLFVFGTLPAVLMPLLVAVSSILTTFLCVLGLTYVTDVSIIVQFLVALVGLGIAIDYSLLMIFRFREEMAARAETVDDAIVETMQHAGRSVIVSGSTVAIGLVSMVILPLPFIRSIGLGGMLIPLVSVLASITLTPALLRLLGPQDQPRPRDAEAAAHAGRRRERILDALGRHRRRGGRSSIFLRGHGVVVLLLIPAFQINPSDAEVQAARRRGRRRRPAGADRRGHHAGRLQAVRRARRRHGRPGEARCGRRPRSSGPTASLA